MALPVSEPLQNEAKKRRAEGETGAAVAWIRYPVTVAQVPEPRPKSVR